MTRYVVRLERDRGGAWLAAVPSVPGCHTYGRTLEQARNRIRQALGLWVEDADEAVLVERIALPERVRRSIRRTRRVRERAERSQQVARRELRRAARELTRSFGLSLRDAGDLLGLSRQRIQQVVGGTRSGGERRARGRAASH